jgi:sarcosine oxidase, subunit beta
VTQRADVIVIGTGLHGSAVAFHLAKRGRRVIALDKEEGGRHSSNVNAGGLRRLLRHPAEIPLAIEAMQIWRDIGGLLGDDCGFRAPGHLKVVENAAEMERVEARLASMRLLGYTHEVFIDRSELLTLVPQISRHCRGALMCRDDGYASPARSTHAFQRAAEALGAVVIRNSAVRGIERVAGDWQIECMQRRFRTPYLVNCAGAWGDVIARMIGDELPLIAESPLMMVTAPLSRFAFPVIGAMGRKLSLKQLPNGVVLIGGGHRGVTDRAIGRARVDLHALSESARTVLTLLPDLQHVPIVRTWAGIEGITPDRLPILGPSFSAPDVFHAFGFSAHGFLLGPLTGRLVAEHILDGRPSLSLAAFAPQRFQRSEASCA